MKSLDQKQKEESDNKSIGSGGQYFYKLKHDTYKKIMSTTKNPDWSKSFWWTDLNNEEGLKLMASSK